MVSRDGLDDVAGFFT